MIFIFYYISLHKIEISLSHISSTNTKSIHKIISIVQERRNMICQLGFTRGMKMKNNFVWIYLYEMKNNLLGVYSWKQRTISFTLGSVGGVVMEWRWCHENEMKNEKESRFKINSYSPQFRVEWFLCQSIIMIDYIFETKHH